MEMIAGALAALREECAGIGSAAIHRIRTGVIKRHRVERGEHADIRNDRRIIFRMTVAVGRNIHHDVDVEVRPSMHHREGILGHLLVDQPGLLPPGGQNRILRADADAAAAADTPGMVDLRLSIAESRRIMGADTGTGMAADAVQKGRIRRTAIVALARQLMVALWRYIVKGEAIEGAIINKPIEV